MGKLTKLPMMAVGLVLALWGTTQLKVWVDRSADEPARLSVRETPAPHSSGGSSKLSHQPTILQAKPSAASRDHSSPRFRERSGGEVSPRWQGAEPGYLMPALPFRALRATSSGDQAVEDAPSTEDRGADIPGALADDLQATAARLERGHEVASWPGESSQPGVATVWRTRANDSLWTISLERYGTGEYYHALFAQNRLRIYRPDRLAEGLLLETPDVAVLRAKFPELCPPAASETASAPASQRLSDPSTLLR